MNTTKTDENGHVLTAQWAEYQKAADADKPQKMISVLSSIKKEAMRKHLPVDFYDAGRKYVNVSVSRNWKLRDSLYLSFGREVEAFGEPIVTYVWMKEINRSATDQCWEYVRSHPKGFSGRNEAFYRSLNGYMGGQLKGFVADDREYVLWDCLQQRQFNPETPEKDEVCAALQAAVKGRYPNEQYLKFYLAGRLPETERLAAMEALAAEFKGTAMSLYPREVLLNHAFTELEKKASTQEEYKALYEQCRVFEKDRKAYTGDEAKIAVSRTGAQALMKKMDAESIRVAVVGDRFRIYLRNLPSAKLTLRNDQKQVFLEKSLNNPKKSFYVIDTLEVPVPELTDGSYHAEAVCGKNAALCSYDRYRLSLALRNESGALAAYAAEHWTGRPVETGELVLWKGDKILAVENLRFDGFTRIPSSLQQKIKVGASAGYALSIRVPEADGRKMESQRVYVSHQSRLVYAIQERPDGVYGQIYLDRGAYNPGDTLKFKTVISKGDLVERLAVVPGMKLTVVLKNAEGQEIDRKKLKTNDFGSASGSFVLPVGQRNGFFSLEVSGEAGVCGSRSVRVDEFVLPTFELAFDENNTLYLPGDEIRVSGKVAAFSGHSLTGARIENRVTRYGTVIHEETSVPAADGSFSFTFKALEAGNYSVESRVVDATGETLDFWTSYYVNDRISVSATFPGEADGSFTATDEKAAVRDWSRRSFAEKHILTGDLLEAVISVRNSNGDEVPLPVRYTLLDEKGTEILSGETASGETLRLDLSTRASGLYTLKLSASTQPVAERVITDEFESRIFLIREQDTVLSGPLSDLFLVGATTVGTGEMIRLRMGTADGEEWAVATLFGDQYEVLETRRLHFDGVRDARGSLADLYFEYKASYPDAVRLQVFYFKHGRTVRFDREFRRRKDALTLPLSFTSLTESAFPGTEYTVRLKTDPGTEALVSVYDKSIDAIAPNVWSVMTRHPLSVPYVSVDAVCGRVTGEGYPDEDDMWFELGEEVPVVVGYGVRTKSAGPMVLANRAAMAEEALVLEAPAMESLEMAADAESAAAVPVREKFENALAFLPHLVSDPSGEIEFTFRTSDKLSTYHVDVYAHDRNMRNTFLRQDVVVTIPVKVAVNEPRYLYAGDHYRLSASVSNHSDAPVAGRLMLQVFQGQSTEPASTQMLPLTVPADGVAEGSFMTAVPSGIDTLVLKTIFLSDDNTFSDAIRQEIPVFGAEQTLTEAHSAVLRDGMDREALLYDLRRRFVNTDGGAATLREIALIDMVREALPDHIEPRGKDVLSLSEAWYTRHLAATVSDFEPESGDRPASKLLEEILACRNGDGGFAWFEGMNSSPVITAVLLERFAKMRDLGIEVPDLSSSVTYLDKVLFDRSLPYWCGWISYEQYLYARSFYPAVPFEVSPATQTGKERLADFKKWAKEYLVPAKARGLNGQILDKARRVSTLRNLLSSNDGIALAKAWGVKFGTTSKMRKSVEADVESLLEYAVEHRDGGWYYPNAVLPFRGLLESEAYAHALLCDLLTAVRRDGGTDPRLDEVADGIRLWLMLQKETQQWGSSPAYLDALTSVLHGSEAVLDTRILALSATYTKPFSEIRAAGNGFTVERKFYRAVTVEEKYNDRTEDENRKITEYQEINPGDPVWVGEKIVIRYEIWNQENRSFVRLSAPREAALSPVNQLSGPYGWWLQPLRIAGNYAFTPQGYQNVKADRTEYYFDSYPEEKTTVSEEFFVTRSGSFSAPVVEIESLYAPHYRANSGFRGMLPAQMAED